MGGSQDKKGEGSCGWKMWSFSATCNMMWRCSGPCPCRRCGLGNFLTCNSVCGTTFLSKEDEIKAGCHWIHTSCNNLEHIMRGKQLAD
eukprot:6075023-Amphidinium_carterae.1